MNFAIPLLKSIKRYLILYKNWNIKSKLEMTDLVNIDGSVLEGGGQILRISISLSAILGIPVRITNIRSNRSKPGLAAQHLTGIQLVANMCGAKIKGASIGSTEIEFIPGKIRGGHYLADTKTAGSISLLLQVSLPCALMADDTVVLDMRGGTNADMAPQIDYMDQIFRVMLNKFGGDFNMDIIKRGYFPRGGGQVRATVAPLKALRAADVTTRGDVRAVIGHSFVAGVLPIKMAHQMADAAKRELSSLGCVSVNCYKEGQDVARDNCSGILLKCELSNACVLGSDALGRRGVDAAAVGRDAGAALAAELASGAAVDSHAQDQLIIYMALAEGRSAVRTGAVTLHTRTAIYIVETITKIKFNIRPDGDTNIIECTGLGYVNKNIVES